MKNIVKKIDAEIWKESNKFWKEQVRYFSKNDEEVFKEGFYIGYVLGSMKQLAKNIKSYKKILKNQ